MASLDVGGDVGEVCFPDAAILEELMAVPPLAIGKQFRCCLSIQTCCR